MRFGFYRKIGLVIFSGLNLKTNEIRGKLRGYYDSPSKNNELSMKILTMKTENAFEFPQYTCKNFPTV